MKEEKHIVFLDYVRIVACLMVMFVHSSENFYGADPTVGMAGNVSMLANESNRFWVAFYDGGVSRTAVPLFFIVSAFLLVPMKPQQTMTTFYRRRFMRILPPFFTFLLLYSLLPLLWGGMTWQQSLATTSLRTRRTDFSRLLRLQHVHTLAPPFCVTRVMGRMFLEPVLCLLVLLGLLRLSGIGTLHSFSSAMVTRPPTPTWLALLLGWRSLHRLVVLVEGSARTIHRDTHAGVELGVLYT